MLHNNIFLFSPMRRAQLENLFVPRTGERAATDKEWNLLPLEAGIHDLLDNRYFALKRGHDADESTWTCDIHILSSAVLLGL